MNEYPVLILSIEFDWDDFKKPDIDNARKTGKSLQYAFDNPEAFTGMQEYIDQSIEYQKDSTIEALWYDNFSCFDYYNMPVLEQSNDEEKEEFHPALLLEAEKEGEIDNDTDIFFNHCWGYGLCCTEGDTHPKNKNLVYIGILPGIGEEIEEQAETGKCAYYYTGPNYFEVWLHKRFVNFEKTGENKMSTKENAEYVCIDIEDYNRLLDITRRLFSSDCFPFKLDEVRDLANKMDYILSENNVQFMESNDIL